MNTRVFSRALGIVLIGAAALSFAPALRAGETELREELDAARDSHQWAQVGELARKLVALDAKQWRYERALAESLFHAEQFAEAVDAYTKAVELAGKPADKATQKAVGDMLIDKGDCLLKLKRFQDAVDAYDAAAPSQAEPAKVYFNICLVEYNHGMKDGALAFAEKTIAADPTLPEAYYIKGSVLAAKVKWSDDEQKYVVPDGTLQALQKYLDLKPGGSRAAEVRNTLKMLQQQ
jgi:tetratricopeptide (TPR) repeat protein